jgi:hypothetical protein
MNGVSGSRIRVSPGETMPPSTLVSSTSSIEVEAIVSLFSSSSAFSSDPQQQENVVSHFICDFGGTDSSSFAQNSCVGFDCEILPDGDEALMNLSAPQGYTIVPRVDGLKGNTLGSRGVIRLDPTASHVVQVQLEDSSGAPAFKQAFFLPRVSLPRCDIFLDKSGQLAIQCPRGIKALACIDGGPEKTTDHSVSIDFESPHLVSLKFLGETLSRAGGREMCRIGEITLKLPPTLLPSDVLELLRLLKEHEPDRLRPAHRRGQLQPEQPARK